MSEGCGHHPTRSAVSLRRQPSSYSLDRLEQRFGRERLREISDASGFHRGCANRIAVIGGNEDNRQRDPRLAQPVPDLYSRLAVQLDVENDADRLLEIVVILKRLCRLKKQALVSVLSQQPFEAFENARIIVDHKNTFSI